MNDGDIAFAVLAALSLFVAMATSHILRRRWRIPLLVMGVLMRVVGAWSYFEVVMRQYHGTADAMSYYRIGLTYAERLWSWDFAGFFRQFAAAERWWGTSFVDCISGLVLTIVGPNLKAEFLAFSLIAFLGLLAMAEGVRRVGSPARANQFAALVFLWPSLWFWPSTAGKESLVLFGLGLTVLGYAGKGRRLQWHWLILGLAITFCCRPHVAVILTIGLGVAHIFRPTVRISLAQVGQMAIILALGWIAFLGMVNLFGVEEGYQQDFEEFAEARSESSVRGGSSLGGTPLQERKPWMALVNFWMRPFLWEAESSIGVLAALEILGLWFLFLLAGSTAWSNLKNWRLDSLLRFALPVLLTYSLVIGSVVGNLGILVRQRTVALPLALLIVCGHTRLFRRKSKPGTASPGGTLRNRHG